MLTFAYIAIGALGCLYIVFSAVIGHGDDAAGGGHEVTGHAHESYGIGGQGHGEASAQSGLGAAFHFPWFSPLAIAALCGSIGAWGLIAKFGFEVSDVTSLVVAVPAAFVTAYAITYASHRLVATSRGSSAIRLEQLQGVDAEVITSIPAGGVGETAAIVAGQRFTASAREVNGRAVARGAIVRVVQMAGNTMIVRANEETAS